MELDITQASAAITVLAGLITGATQLFKQVVPVKYERFVPLIPVACGLVFGGAVAGYLHDVLWVAYGFVAALVSAGVYSGTKTMVKG